MYRYGYGYPTYPHYHFAYPVPINAYRHERNRYLTSSYPYGHPSYNYGHRYSGPVPVYGQYGYPSNISSRHQSENSTAILSIAILILVALGVIFNPR